MTDSICVFPPGFRMLDEDGAPVSGAKAKFYDAGTTTPKTVYSDKDLGSSLGSTVYSRSDGFWVASSGSETTVAVFIGSGTYKVVITDSDDVTIWSGDNLKGALDTSTFLTTGSTSTLSIPVVSTSGPTRAVGTADKGKLINVNTSGASVTLTLDNAADLGDRWSVRLRKTSASNAMIVQTADSETLNFAGAGAPIVAFTGLGEEIEIGCDGTAFYVMGHTPPFFNAHGVIEIEDRITSAPVGPSARGRYIVTSAFSTYSAGDVIEYDGVSGYITYTPTTDCGWVAFVKDEGANYQFRGSAWVRLAENVQVFTSSGTYTPTAGMVKCKVTSTGGGGGGGAADANDGSSSASGGGGGAGGTCIEWFTAADIGASQTVTIGAGGAGGVAASGATGTTGGDTTFGALHTASGGAGGGGIRATAEGVGAGGLGGAAANGTINIPGGDGGSGVSMNGGNTRAVGGLGGSSIWGSGGKPGIATTATATAGTAARAYGAGGGGAAASDANEAAGGAGKDGICIVEEYF